MHAADADQGSPNKAVSFLSICHLVVGLLPPPTSFPCAAISIIPSLLTTYSLFYHCAAN